MSRRKEIALFAAAYLLYNAGRGVTSGEMDLGGERQLVRAGAQ